MSKRSIYVLGFVVITLLLSLSVALQFFDGQIPCPLCTLQRIAFGILGMLFFIGIFVHRFLWGSKLIALFSLVFASFGTFFAGRQLWLQYYPTSESNECGVSLQYMMEVLPINEVIQKIFSGSAECTQRGFEFLRLNMAEWSLIWFLLFIMTSLYLLVKKS